METHPSEGPILEAKRIERATEPMSFATQRVTMAGATDMYRTDSFDNVDIDLCAAMIEPVIKGSEPVIKGSDDIEAGLVLSKGEEAPPFATPQPTLSTKHGFAPAAASAQSSGSWMQAIQSDAHNTSGNAGPKSLMRLRRSSTGVMFADQVKRVSPKRAERRSLSESLSSLRIPSPLPTSDAGEAAQRKRLSL